MRAGYFQWHLDKRRDVYRWSYNAWPSVTNQPETQESCASGWENSVKETEENRPLKTEIVLAGLWELHITRSVLCGHNP